MSRQPQGEISLKVRIGTQLARLGRLVAVDGWNGETPDLQLSSWPGWIEQLLADLVLLRPHDPMAALRGFRALGDRVTMLELCHEDEVATLEPVLDCQERARALQPDFHLALAQADRDTLVDHVFTLLTEPGLLDQDDGFPQLLLDALGRDGRDRVVGRLIEAGDPAARESPGLEGGYDWSWSVTELLLACSDVGRVLSEIDRLGLVDRVCPASVVRFLLRHKAIDWEFMAWMRRAIASVPLTREGGEEDSLWRPDLEGIAVCEAEGLTSLAQEIRYASFEILLDVARLHDWLERLPESRRPREKARALRHVCADPRRSRALLVLLGWPDLEAAARLVMEHHDEMDGQSCTMFNEAARQLEESAPVAAMLLYRRGALNQLSDPTAWHDSRPELARCASLWDRHPDSASDSHEAFLDQLERDRQERRAPCR